MKTTGISENISPVDELFYLLSSINSSIKRYTGDNNMTCYCHSYTVNYEFPMFKITTFLNSVRIKSRE